MEGIENSLVPSAPQPPLRLMRFSFEPNTPLLQETEQFIQESRRRVTPIRFYASRQLLLSVPHFYEHEGSLQNITRKFTAFTEPLHVSPMIRSKQLANDMTRFQLRTTDQEVFDKLTSLEVRPETKFDNYVSYEHGTLQQLPNKIENQPDTGHYLFIDIATNALIGDKERRMAEHAFISKAAAHKFFLHTIELNRIRDYYPVSEPIEQHTESSTYKGQEDLPEAG